MTYHGQQNLGVELRGRAHTFENDSFKTELSRGKRIFGLAMCLTSRRLVSLLLVQSVHSQFL